MHGQNLVQNPGFEEYEDCPHTFRSDRTEREVVTLWYAANDGTPDYYNVCSGADAGVPRNWAGSAEAHSGGGYAGIYVYGANMEHLQSKLKKPLTKDKIYHVSMYFRLSSYSRVSSDRLAASLSRDSVNINASYIHIKDSAITPATGTWEHMAFDYYATGGEEFITIGNFGSTGTKAFTLSHKKIIQPMLSKHSYFYIDDVSVVASEVLPFAVLADSLQTVDYDSGKVYILRDLLFAFDRYDLPQESREELDHLVDLLNNIAYRIELVGYTDATGGESYNLELSIKRAVAVKNYLIQAGISHLRIDVLGLGELEAVDYAKENLNRLDRKVTFKLL